MRDKLRNSFFGDTAPWAFFFCFEGIFCIAWVVMTLCNYPINAVRITNCISIVICCSVCAYLIYSNYRKFKLNAFIGLSLPLALFWLFAYCRFASESFLYSASPVARVLLCLHFPIMILAFSAPLSKKTIEKSFYMFFLPYVIITVIMFFNWYDWIWTGATARTFTFRQTETKILDCLWIQKQSIWALRVGLIGGILALLSFWGFAAKKIHFCLFLPLYILGSIFIYFTVFKFMLIAWVITHLYILGACNLWRRKISLLLIPLLVIINLILFFHIGKDGTGYPYRATRFKNQINFDSTVTDQATELPTTTEGISIGRINKIIEKVIREHTLQSNSYTIKSHYTDKTAQYSSMEDLKELYERYGDPRLVMYTLTYHLVKEHPITGYGRHIIMNFGDHYSFFTPHANTASAFLATGLIGGILFLATILIGFYDSWLLIKKCPESCWLAIIFIFGFLSQDVGLFGLPVIWLPLVAIHACVKTQSTDLIGRSALAESRCRCVRQPLGERLPTDE